MALPLQSAQPIPPKSNGANPLAEVTSVPLDQLLPPMSQPRRYFDGTAMAELTASIRENGILQPLLVRSVGDKYEIVAGGRRYFATAGLPDKSAKMQRSARDFKELCGE